MSDFYHILEPLWLSKDWEKFLFLKLFSSRMLKMCSQCIYIMRAPEQGGWLDLWIAVPQNSAFTLCNCIIPVWPNCTSLNTFLRVLFVHELHESMSLVTQILRRIVPFSSPDRTPYGPFSPQMNSHALGLAQPQFNQD